MQVVRELSSPAYAGRATGTPGGRAAARFIERRFETLGLKPAGGSRYQHPFDVTLPSGPPQLPSITGQNVVGIVEGSSAGADYVIVSAHYDHLGVVNGRLYPGADDNASGVAVLLAAAAHFAAERPQHPMMFVAFDGEELDLAGSNAFMARPPVPPGRMRLVVNLDMVSRSSRREIFAAGTSHYPFLRPVLEGVAERAGLRLLFGHDRPGERAKDDWTMQSDHWPFHRAGVPFVYFGVEDHADYHRPTDTPERIDEEFLGAVAELVVEAIRELDEDKWKSEKVDKWKSK
jgi:Zn-dependent M28 family amino/carboxypeptidase